MTVCANAAVPAVNFSGCPAPAETFSWTTAGANIGLTSPGSGNIASFPGQNTTDMPAVTEVDVTPWANGCSGPVSTFSITVNPIPTMTVTSPTPYCPGDVISSTSNGYNVSTDPVGTVTYTWTATNQAGTGMPANGTGNAPNTAYPAPANPSQVDQNSIVTYTPSLNGCVGPTVTETLTVKPTPTMVAMADQYWCPAANTTPVTFATMPASAASTYTYSYNAGGGVPATGSTNPFPSLVTSNPNLTTLSTVVTVTPTLNGCVGPPSGFTIFVYPNPIAQFSSANHICDGQPMSFTDLSKPNTGTITVNTWAWDMNSDGSVDASSQNPTYTYPPGSVGTNSVTLYIGTSSAPSCTAQVTEPVYINPNPVADFVGDSLKSCPTLHTNFTNLTTVLTPTTGLTYVWSFGNGNSSTAITPPQQTYTNASATQSAYYDVSLTVKTDSGCVNSKTKQKYIQVYPRPIADFSWGPSDADIDNPTITFVNEAQGAGPYVPVTYGPHGVQYYLGDIYASNANFNNVYGSNVIGSTFTHTYEHYDTATYYVTQWVINTLGCKDEITKPVHIGPNFTFYIPNAFSPNGDGTNEGFKGLGVGIDNTTYNLWVFDRWGLMIFYADDIDKAWDGHMRGNEGKPVLQEDVYVWKVKFNDFTGKKHEFHGTVTLLR
jgi:gliding motility-associated-like protein